MRSPRPVTAPVARRTADLPAVERSPADRRKVQPPAGRTPSRDVEQALVDAAERVLVRDGPDAVTVRAVAQEAGVAPMGVYNRFGGKDGLVDALLIRGFDGLRDAIAPHGESDPTERLINAGLRYRQFALANSAHYLAMFDDAIHQEQQSAEVMPHAQAAFTELVGHVRYGMVGGDLMTGDPFEIAQQIWSTVHGAVQLEIKGMLKVEDADRTYRNLLQTLHRGLRAQSSTPITSLHAPDPS